jgi:hypothetical protein
MVHVDRGRSGWDIAKFRASREALNLQNAIPRADVESNRGTHNFIVAVVRLVLGVGRGVRGCR